MDTFLISNR